jgi:predicted nucleic acid-binding protein
VTFTADSSVWIDYFNGHASVATDALDAALNDGHSDLLMLDLVLMEVLRGFRFPRALQQAEQSLAVLPIALAGGQRTARAAAYLYRALRGRGITVRSAIDLMVGAWCIEHGVPLLHADRDFDGMAAYHGLQVFRPGH